MVTNSPRGPAGERRSRFVVLVVATALVAGATGFAGWQGWSWFRAANDEGLAYAAQRDDVLRVGQMGIATFNTLDHRKIDEGLDRWQSISTGALQDEMSKNRDSYKKRIQDAKTTTSAKVLDAAVTELDAHAGKAKVIAAVDIVVTPDQGQPAPKRNRFVAELTRTDVGWKLSGLGAVPVASAGQ